MAFALSNDGLLVVDFEQWTLLDINPSGKRILEFSQDSLNGIALPEVLSGIEDKRWSIMQTACRNGDKYEAEILFFLKKKSSIPATVQLEIHPISSESTPLALVVLRDVTELRRAKHQQRVGETRYEMLVKNMFDGVVVIDEQGTIVEFTPASQRMFGYTSEEVLGQNVRLLMPEPYRSDHQTYLKNYLQTGQRKVIGTGREVMGSRKDGTIFPINIGIEVLTLDKRILFVGILRDLSNEQAMLRSLEESDLRFRQLAETIEHCFWFMNVNPERILYVNPAFEVIWGRTAEELYEDARLWIKSIHPEDRPRIVESFSALAQGIVMNWQEEYRVLRPDGTIRWVIDSGLAIHDKEGRVTRLSGIATDVTQTKHEELRIRQQEQKFRAFVENIADGVVIIDREAKIVVVNARTESLFGYTRQELIGLEVHMLLPLELRDRHKTLCADYIRNTPEVRPMGNGLELQALHKDGTLFPVEIGLLPLDTEEGRLVAATIRDLTEKKLLEEERNKLEAQMLHAQKLESLGVLAGGIAHDFNNLLTAILGNAGLARMQLAEDLPVQEVIGQIETISSLASDLVKQLLAFAGKGRMTTRLIHLSQLVEDMRPLLKSICSKRAEFHWHLDHDSAMIEGDPGQIRQIVLNLVVNGSDALGEAPGHIWVRTGIITVDTHELKSMLYSGELSEGSYVHLEIQDSGCGMTKDVLQRIFDPFFTTKSTGRGIGLAAVVGIIRKHKGAITVHSTVGEGTTFRVLFPSHTNSHTSSEEVTSAATPTFESKATVMIVDDMDAARKVAQRIISRAGMQTLEASNGQQALELYKEHGSNIDLVLLDLTMPQKDGIETFRELQHLDEDVRVVLMSGYNEIEATKTISGKGLCGFLNKPYRSEEVIDMIRQALQE